MELIPWRDVGNFDNKTISPNFHCQNWSNWTVCFKNITNCLTTNIDSYIKTSGGQSSNLYLNVVHFFNTSVN